METITLKRTAKLSTSTTNVRVVTESDIMDTPVTVKVIDGGIEIKRATILDYKTHKFTKKGAAYVTDLILKDFESCELEFAPEESDSDTLTYLKP